MHVYFSGMLCYDEVYGVVLGVGLLLARVCWVVVSSCGSSSTGKLAGMLFVVCCACVCYRISVHVATHSVIGWVLRGVARRKCRLGSRRCWVGT